jgi:hypothetical protein
MTIATRPDWNGNASTHTFDDVAMALDYMKENPCYEILPEGNVRPFGDIDFKVSSDMTEDEFNAKDFQTYQVLAEFFKDHRITIFSASSYVYRKISHRWVIPDCYVKSLAHAKAFANDVYSRIQFPEGAVADLSVYSKSRKMRTFWTSKPNENRPFFMLQGEEEDHIISYIPKWATLIDFDLETEEQSIKPVCADYEESYLTKLCDCILPSTWESYTECQSLIFTLLSLGATSNLIHSYCSKAKNYSHKWVHDYIRGYKPSKNAHTIGTLKFFAKRDNQLSYTSLGRDPIFAASMGRRMFEEMTKLTEDETTLQDWNDENGFLKPLPLVRTLAVKSQLGTGKTRRCIEACTPSPWNTSADTVLVMSCRQTFTTHICAELTGFVDYRTIKGDTIDNPKVVVQLQSLWKCADMKPRDLLLLDEVESILASLTPNKTHKHYLQTIRAFETLVRSAKRVIVLDAFLTDRTIEMLKTLRGDCVIAINPTQPYKKTATLVSESGLYSSIQSTLRDGKTLVSVWGAKNKAKAFHSLLPPTVKHVLYTGDSCAKVKALHLADVNKYWAEHHMVGYTATITVGINYNGPPFHELSLYATPWSCPSRDYIQALHRARTVSNNHITAFIQTEPRPCSFEAGIDEQEKQFATQTDRVKKFLHDIGQSPLDYSTLPAWLHRILMWNMNETITNYKHFEECMKGYFRLCGISFGENAELETTKTKQTTTHISVADVADIDYQTAQEYSRNRQVLSEGQMFELEKYYMIQKVVQVDDFIWSAWLDSKKQVERAHAVFNKTPEDLIRDKVVDLVPKDAERLHLFQKLSIDWDTSWEKPVAEVPTIDLALFGQRLQSNKQTPDQYCRDLSKALKQWCLVETKVVRKRASSGNREYSYTLKYEPHKQVFSYIARPLSATELFGDAGL